MPGRWGDQGPVLVQCPAGLGGEGAEAYRGGVEVGGAIREKLGGGVGEVGAESQTRQKVAWQ